MHDATCRGWTRRSRVKAATCRRTPKPLRGGRRHRVLLGALGLESHNTFVEVFLTDKVERSYAPGEIKMGCDHSLQFWVVDPNGVDVEFYQYTDKSAQLTRTDIEVDW